MKSNVQSVATFATVGGVTNDVVVSNLAARYPLPLEKVRKLSKIPTHLEVSDHLIISRYVCSNIVANIVTNIYMYVMRHVRT